MKTLIIRTPGSPQIETDRLSAYLLKNLELETEFSTQTSTIAPTTEPLVNPTFPGAVKLKNGLAYYKKGQCDWLIILWNPNTNNYTSNTWYHPDGTIISEVAIQYADDFYRVTSHEIEHGLVQMLLGKFGIMVPDVMDDRLLDYSYSHEMEPDAQNGNRARQNALLQPYLSKLDPQKLALLSRIDELKAIVVRLLASIRGLKTPNGYDEIVATFGQPGEANQVVFDLPYPLYYAGTKVTRSRCHKLMVPIFQAVLRELKAKGLDKYVQNYGGIYNYRQQRTGDKVSTHAWGIAIDIEPQKYPLGGKLVMPKEVVDVFKSHGFMCGEDFPIRDAGHFQYAKNY